MIWIWASLGVVASVLACWGFAKFVDWFIKGPAGDFHWTADADRIYGDDIIDPDLKWLGEDEYGDWWVGNEDGWERWDPKSVGHLAAYRRSWSHNVLVFLERV